MTSDYEIKLLIKKECFLIIQRKKTINFYRNYFLSDSECPQTEDPNRNFGSSKQIREKTEKTNHDRLFGATKIPMGVLRLGTLRIREKIISIEMDCLVTLYTLPPAICWYEEFFKNDCCYSIEKNLKNPQNSA